MLNIRTFTFNLLQERTYVAWQGEGSCVVVDPGCYGPAELQALEDLLAQERLTPAAILLTHGHFDHIFGVKALQDRFGGIPVYMHPADEAVFGYGAEMAAGLGLAPAATDFLRTPVRDGQVLEAAGIRFEVIATPGHTPGGVCYHFPAEKLLLSGDTLFAGSCGRTDFPGGSMSRMMDSLRRLAALPGDTLVIPGHGMFTTIARERDGNPYML